MESTLLFSARSSLARSLYVGCPPPRLDITKPRLAPLIIVAGVQKGGSSSARDLLHRYGLCEPGNSGELHFFNHECFAVRPVQDEERAAYYQEWRHCRSRLDTRTSVHVFGRSSFDKSPATYIQPWIPLRVCQALPPRQKILLLLREPVARAFSGYRQCHTGHTFSPPRLLANASRRNLDGFSVAAALEVDVARRCSPWGTGEPERDAALGEAFSACCVQVAQEHGLREPSSWPLCRTTPHCANGTRVGHHARGASRRGGAFGQWCYTHVLAGVYVRYLRLWYRHHRPHDILLGRSEDFYANQSGFMSELMPMILGLNRSYEPPKATTEIRSAQATRGRTCATTRV